MDPPTKLPEFVEECEDDGVASPELGEEVSVPELDSALDTKAPSVRRTVTLVTVESTVLILLLVVKLVLAL